jgi:L-alanine-DL-glutamate epimerase-like enolase superfamily enzyme
MKTGDMTELRMHRLELPLQYPIHTGHGVIDRRPTILLEWVSDARHVWGEVPSFLHSSYMADTHLGMWHTLAECGNRIGLGLQTTSLRPDAWGKFPLLAYALDAVQCQIEAIHQKKSLMAYFGIDPRPISGLAMLGMAPTVDDLFKRMAYVAKAGYDGIKFKVTPPSLPTLQPVLNQAVTQFLHVAIDANGTFDATTIHELTAIPESVTIEQPTHHVDVLRHFVQQTPHAVVLDESVRCMKDLDLAYELGVGVMLKPAALGGLRPTLNLLDRCNALGIPCGISGYLDSGLGRYFQWVLAQHAQWCLPPDFSWSTHYFKDDVLDMSPRRSVPFPLTVDYHRFCQESKLLFMG